jgi:hypothetical protein
MIVFETPGLIDMRAFTLMGVSSKPNAGNPIGYFGTGLKYAMSVLVRLGAEPVVYCGKDRYTFQKKDGEFRGKEYEGLRMKLDKFSFTRSRYIDLPYATSYGRNWEAWMAFRELESNTIDEKGRSYKPQDHSSIEIEADKTLIMVDLPAFTEAYHKRDEIFLPDAVRKGTGLQTIDKPSHHLYWRGLRVFKTNKPTLLTYNFLDHLDLTEDRTLSNPWYARILLGRWVVNSNDEASIEKILTADEKFWEHGIEFSNDVAPSRAFHNVMLRNPKRVSGGAWNYYSRYDERVVEKTYDLFDSHPLPWKIEGTSVLDFKGRTVFEARYGYVGKWDLAAAAILRRINPEAPKDEIDNTEPEGSDHEG